MKKSIEKSRYDYGFEMVNWRHESGIAQSDGKLGRPTKFTRRVRKMKDREDEDEEEEEAEEEEDKEK